MWQWRSYAEGMESNCGSVTYGDYAARHNPAVYYTNIRRQCEAWDEPMGTPNQWPIAPGPCCAPAPLSG